MKKVYVSSSVEETEKIGSMLASKLKDGDVIAYFGGLGMGKTAFTRGLARGLGIDERVTSPTFTLVNEYRGKRTLCHFDMYRINGFDDLVSTGFFDYLENGSILAIEWSENIKDDLPENAVTVTFESGDTEDTRIITIEAENNEYSFD